MIAVFEVSHPRRGECDINVGIGTVSLPVTVKCFNDYIVSGPFNVTFPDNKMVMDVTELLPSLQIGSNDGFFSVFDWNAKPTGTITHFSIETYDNYLSGSPTEIYLSIDTPLDTVNSETVATYITID